MEGIAIVKRSFIVSLFLLASSSALACNPAQGTGQGSVVFKVQMVFMGLHLMHRNLTIGSKVGELIMTPAAFLFLR